jgi:hypothetical protein
VFLTFSRTLPSKATDPRGIATSYGNGATFN